MFNERLNHVKAQNCIKAHCTYYQDNFSIPQPLSYHRQGKIHWAKYLQFQCYQSFHGNTFALPWP